MADMISRLKLESGEFDSKIARATKGLLTMEKECRSVGGTLAILEQDQKEYIKSLGQMETVSQDARGKIGELTKAFTELSLQYKRLTDEEKQGDFGTALAGSLEQLKTRIRDGRAELEAIEQSVSQIGGSFDKLAQEIGIPADELQNMIGRSESAKQQFREYNDTIVTLTQAYNGLSEAEKNSESGQKMAAHIEELKGKAAQLKDAIADTNEELKHMASDTAFTDGIGLMARTVGSCAAAITAWTGDSKEMEVVIKDLAKIGTTVAAVESLTKAFQKQNLVLLKNPYVAAAAAVVALGAAIGKLIQKSQELSAVEKALQDVQAKGRENAAKEVTKIETLNNILHDNTRSLEERRSALAQIQSLVPDYHGALTAEGTLINDNTDAMDGYIDSLQRAATAQAAFDKMVELQKTKMEKQVELQKAQNKLAAAQSMQSAGVPSSAAAFGGGGGMSINTAVAGTNNMAVKTAESAVNSIQKVIDEQDAQINALRELVKANDLESPTTTATTGKGGKMQVTVEPVLPEGSAAALKKQIADLQDAWNKASTQDERNSIKGQIDAASEALKAMTPQIEPVAVAIKDAAAMWTEHSEKIKDVKARLAEFQAMMGDTSLSDDQRDWAAGMAESYQKQLEKMQGTTEEVVEEIKDNLKEIPSSFEMFKDGVGAVGSLVGAMDNLKSIGEDLASAFSGEMDAWDSLMTVLNSGIGIMETVISVIEAINTLTELSAALKEKNAIAQAAETTAVVSGKGAEAAAETAETAASGAATAANTAEAAAGAGKAMAGIPIVGPVLAIAAIAAVLAAVLAATSKAKSSAGNYAVGGIVPGSSFSGDNLTANVNSGELILNRAQQGSIASQLQGAAQQTVMVEGRISGKDILLSANNTNRAAGGSRGYYTKVK